MAPFFERLVHKVCCLVWFGDCICVGLGSKGLISNNENDNSYDSISKDMHGFSTWEAP